MNIWITASLTTSPSAAHAIRQRLMNPAKVVRIAPPEPEPVVTNIAFVYRCKQPKDAHVRAWQWHVAQEGCKVQSYMRRRARELGVSVEDMTGQRRCQLVVNARQRLMYELRKDFGLSFPEIGRKFGGRDHTTVMHACTKIAALVDRPVSDVPLTEQRRIIPLPPGQLAVIRLRAQGYSNKETETMLGITKCQRKGRIQRAMASTRAGSLVGLIAMAKKNGWLA